MDISIIIPTKNAGDIFEDVLSKVFSQKTKYSYEVICVDSGSSDNTIEIIKKFNCKLYEIAPSEFGHGKTRNYGASKGTGEFIVFITQDAKPFDNNWLDNLVSSMSTQNNVAGAFGAHMPYEDCNPFDSRDIIEHFKGFGETNTVYSIDDWCSYFNAESYRHIMAFFSDNNSCIRRSVWEVWPYPDVNFAEDQIWMRNMLEKGYKKVFCPNAKVYHSHNYDLETYFGRYFDEYKSLYELHHFAVTRGIKSIKGLIKEQVDRDIKYLDSLSLTKEEKSYWSLYAKKRAKYKYWAGFIGEHYHLMSDELKQQIDRDISQQYRQLNSVNRNKMISTSTILALVKWKLKSSSAMDTSVVTSVRKSDGTNYNSPISRFDYVMKRETTGIIIEDYNQYKDGPIYLNWIVPEMGPGSGGHINIFRFLTRLQDMGFKNRIYISKNNSIRNDKDFRLFLKEHFDIDNKEIEMYVNTKEMAFAHGTIATSWDTAYYVREFGNTISKFYFVQDYEPYFYAMGSEYMFAENTYKFGFRGITAGDWLKEKLSKDYGMRTDSFGFSYDRDLYKSFDKKDTIPRIFFYARPVTPRRSFELGLLALGEISRKIPDLEVVFAGWDIGEYVIPFNHKSLGIVKVEYLSQIYSQSDMCLVLSNTNLSLLPLEIMASNSVPVCTKGANSEWLVNDSNSIMVEFDPVLIADTIIHYFENRDELDKIRNKGMEFAHSTSWDKEADKVRDIIMKGIIEDEKSSTYTRG